LQEYAVISVAGYGVVDYGVVVGGINVDAHDGAVYGRNVLYAGVVCEVKDHAAVSIAHNAVHNRDIRAARANIDAHIAAIHGVAIQVKYYIVRRYQD
jgi:hypothetical protein